jgi:hypothetical protein
MSYSKPKCIPLLRKRDCSPFLDAALEFLFAIVEGEIQKNNPAFIPPSVSEFYFFSNQISQAFQIRKKQKSRKSNRFPLALQTVFCHSLGPIFTSHVNRSKQKGFLTCTSTVILAILAYSEFLTRMGACEVNGHIQSALYWYFSHYFLVSKHQEREKVLQSIWREIFHKRNQILKEFLHVNPSLLNVQPCLEGMQAYFSSESFQKLFQEMYKSVISHQT